MSQLNPNPATTRGWLISQKGNTMKKATATIDATVRGTITKLNADGVEVHHIRLIAKDEEGDVCQLMAFNQMRAYDPGEKVQVACFTDEQYGDQYEIL